MEVVQTDCNADFMQHILPSLAWPAVLVAAEAVGMKGVPEELTPELLGKSKLLGIQYYWHLTLKINKQP